MSDLINALQDAAGGQSSLPKPVLVNPLAAEMTGAEAAQRVFGVREKQAEQAIGAILQQSTDANGNVDYQRAHSLAAQAGPVVQMGMQKMLQNTSRLTNEQQINLGNRMHLISSIAPTIMRNPSDENVNAAIDMLVSNGMPKEQAEAVRQQFLSIKDPNQRAMIAYRYGLSALDGLQRIQQTLGTTSLTNIGGSDVATTVVPPTPSTGPHLVISPEGTIRTMSPDSVGQTMVTWPATEDDVKSGRASSIGQTVRMGGADLQRWLGQGGLLPPGARIETTPVAPSSGPGSGGGVVTSNGRPVGPKNQPRLLNVPGATSSQPNASTAAPLPVPPVPPASPSPAATPAPAPAAPSVNAPTDSMTPGRRAAVEGDVNAILAGIDARRVAGRSPGTQTAGATFSVGPGEQDVAEWKASSDRLAADDTAAANFAQTQFPLAQTLKEYGRGTVTGPGADWWNRVGGYIRTPLQKLGVSVGALDTANERYDSLNKWLGQIVSSTPFAAGSDARLAAVLNGNANTHINQGAGEDMIKAGYVLQRMGVAANNQWHSMSSSERAQYGGLYMNFLRGYANRVDPRAFGVDLYNEKQLADLREQLKKEGNDSARRFNESKALADALIRQPALPTR